MELQDSGLERVCEKDKCVKGLHSRPFTHGRMPSEQAHFVQAFFRTCTNSSIVYASARGTAAVGGMTGSVQKSKEISFETFGVYYDGNL